MSRRLWPLVALAVIGAACSDGSAGSGGAGAGTEATRQDKAVKFAACMRENGVADFPDPDAKGEFAYGVSVSPAVWQSAVRACKDLQPAGALSAKRTPEEQTATLRFAECMRENGVKDFPDPANGEPLVDTTKIPSSDTPGGMAILNQAMRKCRSVMDEAAADR